MYDQDGNGWIDLVEMTRIVKSIYSMMGPDQVEIELPGAERLCNLQVKVSVEEQQSPEERAHGIFTRMDINSDGKVTRLKQIDLSLYEPARKTLFSNYLIKRQEFVQACIKDQKLVDLLSPQFQT